MSGFRIERVAVKYSFRWDVKHMSDELESAIVIFSDLVGARPRHARLRGNGLGACTASDDLGKLL